MLVDEDFSKEEHFKSLNKIPIKNSSKDDESETRELTIDDLNSYFAQIQKEEIFFNLEIASKILLCAESKILISTEQLDLLINIALSIGQYNNFENEDYDDDEILKIINKYSTYKEDNWFMSILPPNFFERLQIFLPNNYIFNTFKNCFLMDPFNVSKIFIQINIIEVILNNLNKDESVSLYAELIKNVDTRPSYESFYPQIISETIKFIISERDECFLDSLLNLIISDDAKFTNAIINDQNFNSLFTQKRYLHRFRYKLIFFTNELCKSNHEVAIILANSPFWSFLFESFSINKKMTGKNEKRKKEFDTQFFTFLYFLCENDEGKIFLFKNNIHMFLFEILKNDQFRVINECIRVICFIGLINNSNIVEQLVKNGLINIISEFITCFDLESQKIVLNCLINIQKIGQIDSIDFLQSNIFENQDLMDAIESSRRSENKIISDLSNSLYQSYSDWIDSTV